jgi:hypothetical protein
MIKHGSVEHPMIKHGSIEHSMIQMQIRNVLQEYEHNEGKLIAKVPDAKEQNGRHELLPGCRRRGGVPPLLGH